MLADVDPETGQIILDGAGEPVLVAHYLAVEAAPILGVRPNYLRAKVRSGEWEGRIQPSASGNRDVVYMTHRHIAAAIIKMQGMDR